MNTLLDSPSREARGHTPAFRRLTAGALGGALAIGSLLIGSTAANAGTAGEFDLGHVDAVHVALDPNDDKLILGSNREDAPALPADGYYPRAEIDATSLFVEPQYDFYLDNGLVIPSDEEDAETLGVVWAGFAGLGNADDFLYDRATGTVEQARNLLSVLDPSTDTITTAVTLVSAPSGESATIDWTGVSGVTASGAGTTVSPYQFTFALDGSSDEAFHRHPEWTFTDSGVYIFKVIASTNNGDVDPSDAVYYRFVVA